MLICRGGGVLFVPWSMGKRRREAGGGTSSVSTPAAADSATTRTTVFSGVKRTLKISFGAQSGEKRRGYRNGPWPQKPRSCAFFGAAVVQYGQVEKYQCCYPIATLKHGWVATFKKNPMK